MNNTQLFKEHIQNYSEEHKEFRESLDFSTIEGAINSFKVYKKLIKNREWEQVKFDLENLFNISISGLTKNKAYLEHQSQFVNNIYKLKMEGEI